MVAFIRPHGSDIRGRSLSRSSLLFTGPFGRIFRTLPPADFGADDQASETALHDLAMAMSAAPDPVKDGPDAEESGIPSLYTYLGQFIDHDLTFDPASSLQKQNDPDALVDFRTPRFDLDNIYGRGPDDQPYLYTEDPAFGSPKFLLGDPMTGAGVATSSFDLPRSGNDTTRPFGRRAIIGDPRNDENVLVSQLQGLFHRFHNAIVSRNRTWDFERVQREVRFHYQWMVINDFLPTVIHESVLSLVAPHIGLGTDIIANPPDIRYFHAREQAYMPLEFSAAAYRFGHSMVRPGYRLNENVGPLAIFDSEPFRALTGFRKFLPGWALDWARFIDIEPRPFGDEDDPTNPDNARRLQLAYRIDTSLVNPLAKLPPEVAGALGIKVLAERNLLRGWRMRLPSGQSVARAMGLKPLADADIKIGKFTGDAADVLTPITQISAAFVDNCPLWTYVLAEAQESQVTVKTTGGDKPITTFKLGPVGGRIVAETILGLILIDSSSYLAQDPLWKPTLGAEAGKFALRDLVTVALSET
jgi:hypothetical protein